MSQAAKQPKETNSNPAEATATAITAEQLQALLQQNEALMREVQEFRQKQAPAAAEKQPEDVVHEIKSDLPVPKRIKYKISALETDDAMRDGFYVPGKKITGQFLYTSEIWMDNDGNYRTGFELDKLEYQTGLKGAALTTLQNEVKAAINYLGRVTDQNLSSRNHNFWNSRGIKVEALDQVYDTQTTEHLINYYNILAGSFPEIAKNREDANARNILLYLDVEEQEAERKISIKLEKLSAGAALIKVKDTWKKKDILFLIYALSKKKNIGYTLDTPVNILINELNEFIEGEGTTEKKKRPGMFLEAVAKMESTNPIEKERIRTEGLIKAADYYHLVRVDKNNNYQLRDGGAIGNSLKAAVDYLTNPSNIDEFSDLLAAITEKWTNN